jgi:hypothetical protein
MQLTVMIMRRIRLEMHKQLGFCTNADTEILNYESSKPDRMLTVYTAWASCFSYLCNHQHRNKQSTMANRDVI